jgi:hypothetical protein
MTPRTLPRVDSFGVIRRDAVVHLLNISLSGCLLEIAFALPVGVVGTLHIRVGATEYCDLVRVARWQRVVGTGLGHQVGVQFVWADAPAERSLRRAAAPGGIFRTISKADVFRPP